jgi:glycosyltransferase involved in cell wall biosynthesis
MLKIAIVVQGRFHAFDLARALIGRGHDVTLLTNYPVRVVERFGVPAERTRSLLAHGAAARLGDRVRWAFGGHGPEARLHEWFGRWAERQLAREAWDLVHVWSGVAEESFRSARLRAGCRLLMRGSAHIDTQAQLLEEEERRASVPIDRPSAWMIARERREYELADHILVLSTFSRQSFEAAGVPAVRLSLLRLGVQVDAFRPVPAVLAERERRVRAGEPLRVLYVGALSFQKGLFDLVHAVRALDPARFRFTLVGPVLPEARALVAQLDGRAHVAGKRPQDALPALYWDADVFLYPTIQDGYPAVAAQARAAGLPMVTTPHGAGLDLVTPGEDGWIVPVRDAAAIAARLRWLDEHRPALAAATARVGETWRARDWADVARDFEAIALRLCGGVPPLSKVSRAG